MKKYFSLFLLALLCISSYAEDVIKCDKNQFSKIDHIFRIPVLNSPSMLLAPVSPNKLDIDFKTGGDNLEPKGFQKNLHLTINIKNRSAIVVDDVNKNQTWPNNSLHRISVPLPEDIIVADLESITLVRTVVNNYNIVDGGMGDNWNLDKLSVMAIIKTNGILVRTSLLNEIGSPLFRFIYDNRGNSNPNAGTRHTWALTISTAPTPRSTVRETTNVSFVANFGTGGDDLRGGNDNIDMVISFRSGRQPITFRDVNARRPWRNFSDNYVQRIMPNTQDIDINDIYTVTIKHSGGGGIGADNWYLDKFKFTVTKGTEAKVLIDRVEAPIHYFTGDQRSKMLMVQ